MSQLSDAVRCAREDGYAQGKKDAVRDGWISVEDRLPEEGKNVLAFIPFRGASIYYVSYLESNKWYVPDRLGRYELDDITHWQPLPEPPKMEEQEGAEHGVDDQ